jgi:riboflavin transporter FmnP
MREDTRLFLRLPALSRGVWQTHRSNELSRMIFIRDFLTLKIVGFPILKKIFHKKRRKTMNQTAVTTKTKSNQKVRQNVRVLAGTAMLSALAFVLQYFEIAIPIMPSFIKFDFSDLPALLGAFAYGPVSGILIELIKNLIHCAVSQSATVGELSNFILGAVFAGTAGLIYKAKKTKKMALAGAIIGSVVMGLVSFPSNYFIVYPFYYNFMPEETVLGAYQLILPSMKSIPQCLVVFNLPFTIVKGLISTAIVMLIYKPLSRILKGRN